MIRDADYVTWSVRECIAPRDACPRGTRCLIFETEGLVRRVWTYPLEWRELDDVALALLSRGV